MTRCVLQATDVSKHYDARSGAWGVRHRRVLALESTSLTIEAGTSIGVVGESGSGKTTLAKLLLGLERPCTGCVQVDGVVVSDAKRTGPFDSEARRLHWYKNVQLVFQDPRASLNPRRLGQDILGTPLRQLTSLNPPEQKARIQELLDLVQLPQRALQQYPHELSGGQAQRLALARALAPSPRLLVLDEALSSLDVSLQAQMAALLHRLRKELNLASLFISHDLPVVEALCDGLLVMHRGRVVESGRCEDVLRQPRDPYTQKLIAAVPRLRTGAPH